MAAVASLAIISGVAALWQDRSLTRLREKGVIRIGYAVEAPYAFLKGGGRVTGESPEVARRIVARLGLGRVEWCQMEFGSLLAGLESGRFDVVAAGMFITPERARRVAFSEPTFHVQQGLLVARGNPRQLHAYEQAQAQAEIRVAAIWGSVEEALLRRLGVPEARLIRVPDALAGRVAVESGVADALALSSPTIQWMALQEQLGKTEMARPFVPAELARRERLGYGGFVFRKRDRQLQSAWNAELRAFIGSPEHRQLLAEFGFSAGELPGSITTAEIATSP